MFREVMTHIEGRGIPQVEYRPPPHARRPHLPPGLAGQSGEGGSQAFTGPKDRPCHHPQT
jgi:hypothetical protein